MQETWVRSLGWEGPLEEGMAIHSIFLPGEFHEQKNLVGYSPWGCKESYMPEATFTFWGFPGGSDGKTSACNAGDPGSIFGSGRSLEKEMAIHSSTLAWKILWTEEPDRLQSMGSLRVGHD